MKKAKFAAAITTVSAMLFVCAFSASAENYAVTGSLGADSEDGTSATVTATVTNDYYYDVDGIGYSVSVSDNAVIKGESSKTDVSLAAGDSDSLTFEVELLQQEESSQPEASKPESSEPESSQPESSEPDSSQPESSQPAGDNPNTGVGVSGAAIAVSVLALAAVGFAAVRKKKQLLSLILCVAVAGTAVVTSLPLTADAEEASDSAADQIIEIELGGETVTVTLDITVPEQPKVHDNSEEDIQRLNDGKAVILRNDKTGKVTFINGRFTDYKVTDMMTAYDALEAVSSLLGGGDENTLLIYFLRSDTMDNGDVYYTFYQDSYDEELENCYIKIGTDKDGNTICLSSSLDDTVNSEDLDDEEFRNSFYNAKKSAEEYAEATGGELIITEDIAPEFVYNQGLLNCWPFYVKLGDDTFRKLCVDVESGEILCALPISAVPDGSNGAYVNDIYFDETTEEMTFTDVFGNEVTLPVAKNDEGYYFLDTERRMICIDSWRSYLEDSEQGYSLNDIVPYTFSDKEDVDPIFVTVFENMRTIYDFYADEGITSIDGRGLPLAIGFGWPKDGKENENACFMDSIDGFGCFMFGRSALSQALDITAHEFTHGIRVTHFCTGEVTNNAGAIEEGYCDILGNILEMLVDPENCDTESWIFGEQSGFDLRCMSDPHSKYQPEYIGDVYYIMNSIYTDASMVDDRGGVHRNNSLLAYIAWKMSDRGISLQDNFDIWKNMSYIYSPKCSFKDIAEMIRFFAGRLGLEEYLDELDVIIDEANLESSTTSWEGYERPEGAIKVTFNLKNAPADAQWSGVVQVSDEFSSAQVNFTCDENGTATGYILPTDFGACFLWIISSDGQKTPVVYYGEMAEDMEFDLDYNELQ